MKVPACCLFLGALACTAALAAPAASEPASAASKRVMRSMSPMTTPHLAAPPPQRIDDVWVNKRSKVYHCPGNRWYGRTPRGEYMSEADARAQGFTAEKGQSCG